MLNGLIVFTAVSGTLVMRKLLPHSFAQVLGDVLFWLSAAIAALFLAFAVWTASGIASGQGFWLVFAAVQVGGAVLVLATGRVLQRLLAA